MSKINVLNMDFEEDNCPDFGSMEMDKRNEDLHLLADDIPKLNEILTRTICVGTYNAENFSFHSGDIAVVDDAPIRFVYNSSSDCWYELGRVTRPWRNPDDLNAGVIQLRLMKDGEAYCLEDDERIICDIKQKSDDTVVLSKTIQKNRYHGGGYYSYHLIKEEVSMIRKSDDYYIGVSVIKAEQDITDSLSIPFTFLKNYIYE